MIVKPRAQSTTPPEARVVSKCKCCEMTSLAPHSNHSLTDTSREADHLLPSLINSCVSSCSTMSVVASSSPLVVGGWESPSGSGDSLSSADMAAVLAVPSPARHSRKRRPQLSSIDLSRNRVTSVSSSASSSDEVDEAKRSRNVSSSSSVSSLDGVSAAAAAAAVASPFFDLASTIYSDGMLTASSPISGSTPFSPSTGRILVGGKRRETTEPLLHDSLIGTYRIVGAGRECSALHTDTQQVFTAQVLTAGEFAVLEKVVARLEEARHYYDGPDYDEMCELVFPSTAEVVEETPNGRRVLFQPRSHGSLHSFAHKNACRMSEGHVAPIFQQVCKLVAFCHQVGILVRDLKLRKLVFADADKQRIRLSGVAEVVVCDSPYDDLIRETYGSPAFVPPEVLSSGKTGYAGRAADVWGMGVLLYMLLIGRYPFFDQTPLGVFQKIKKAKFDIPPGTYLSKMARALLYGILRREPEERPSAALLAQLDWIEASSRPCRPVEAAAAPTVPAEDGAAAAAPATTGSGRAQIQAVQALEDFLRARSQRRSGGSSQASAAAQSVPGDAAAEPTQQTRIRVRAPPHHVENLMNILRNGNITFQS